MHKYQGKAAFFIWQGSLKHRWYKELNKEAVDLGSGKRVVVKNGKLDKEFQLTVPNSSEGGLY